MKKLRITGFIAIIAIIIAFLAYFIRINILSSDHSGLSEPNFTGSASCSGCHAKEYELWKGSHHDLAMDSATDETVRGDFNDVEFRHRGKIHRMFKKDGKFFVNTEGPGGIFRDFQITYTFGYTPLQQYLVPFEGGKLQCLPLAWDTEKRRWFHLGDTVYKGQDIRPDNWLYWTNQAQNWNGMCADCHSTNLKKGYDPETGTYNTTWSEIDVSCEACHGPASGHIEWANMPEDSRPRDVNTGLVIRTRNLDNRELLNICARCHSRRAILGDYHNDNTDLLNYMIPQLISAPFYYSDGQILEEDYEYASFTQSKMFEKGIKCSDCHDSHSARTLRDDNELCMKCHRPDLYNTTSHHFHKMPDPSGKHLVNRGKPEYEQGTGSQCVNCHMTGRFYMGNDYRRDHSFRNPRPDLTLSIATPNACNGCHTDKSAAWSQGYIEKWYGSKKRPHYGEIFAAAGRRDPRVIPQLVMYSENELFPLMIRATAVSLLAGYRDSVSIGATEKALSDPASLVRYSAANGFRADDINTLEKMLLPLLKDPVLAIRTKAGVNLSVIPENQLSDSVKKAIKAALDEYVEINLYTSDFPGGLYNLGIMYSNVGQLEKAAELYRDALKIDGLFYMAKVNLASVYNRQGKNADAELLLKEVLKENPEIHQVYYSLALLLAEMGRYDESRMFFEKSVKLLPDQPRILYNFALFENSRGNTDKAGYYLSEALKADPVNFDFLYAACTFSLEHKQYSKAVEYAKRIIENYPQNPAGNQLLQAASRY